MKHFYIFITVLIICPFFLLSKNGHAQVPIKETNEGISKEEYKKLVERVDILEKKLKSQKGQKMGLKVEDYKNREVADNENEPKQSKNPYQKDQVLLSKEKREEIMRQIESLKKQQKEKQKYLKDLMEE